MLFRAAAGMSPRSLAQSPKFPQGLSVMFLAVPLRKIWQVTLPETNMAPENNPLEKEIPIGNHHF